MKSPEWIRGALKDFFVNYPNVSVNSVDLMVYFRAAIVLNAAQDLVDAGWLIKTDDLSPRFKRSLKPKPNSNNQ